MQSCTSGYTYIVVLMAGTSLIALAGPHICTCRQFYHICVYVIIYSLYLYCLVCFVLPDSSLPQHYIHVRVFVCLDRCFHVYVYSCNRGTILLNYFPILFFMSMSLCIYTHTAMSWWYHFTTTLGGRNTAVRRVSKESWVDTYGWYTHMNSIHMNDSFHTYEFDTYEWCTRVNGVIHMYLIHMYLWIRYIWMTSFMCI